MRIGASGRIGWIAGLVGLVLAGEPAHAQLASVASSLEGSRCSGGSDAEGDCRQSVELSDPNDGTSFTSRYAFNVDANTSAGGVRDEEGAARHTVAFTATAPGSYRITIESTYFGAAARSSDLEGCQGAILVTFPSGASNVPLTSGSLTPSDPFVVPSGGGTGFEELKQGERATIEGLSNGVAQSHVLTFTFTASVRSSSCEVAVRFGEQSRTTRGCSICGYAGDPPRDQKGDGHFVRVSLLSFCGNGLIDGLGEECDEGAANGAETSCCTADCRLRLGVCRPSAGDCDVAESCSGKDGTCPDDAFLPNVVCRSAAGICDVPESCTGSSPACPIDGFQPDTVVCRGAEGICDVPESCTGVSAECPPDAFESGATVCRPATSSCDVAERCDGVSAACPKDAFAPRETVCRAPAGDCDAPETCSGKDDVCPADAFRSSTVCRSAAGVCDVPESCDGTSPQCPADAFADGSTVCRSAADTCDVAERCDGKSAACPADAFQPSTLICRGAEGACDLAESCTGDSPHCPPDAVADASTVCRPATGVCDVAERCDGASVACPQDRLAPSSTVCRPAVGTCDLAERCTGVDAACPADVTAPDGDPCSDGDQCTLGDRCHGGACEAGPPVACEGDGICNPVTGTCASALPCPLPCDDGNPCTDDSCDTKLARCVNAPVGDGAACDRTDPCTSGPETCRAGSCGVRLCAVDASQVVEDGVPQPAIDVTCEVLATRRNGSPKDGSCSGTVFDGTAAGALGTPLADVLRRGPKPSKRTALSARGATPIRGGHATFRLMLTDHGRQLLGESPNGLLTVEVRGRIAVGRRRKAFAKVLTLRR